VDEDLAMGGTANSISSSRGFLKLVKSRDRLLLAWQTTEKRQKCEALDIGRV